MKHFNTNLYAIDLICNRFIMASCELLQVNARPPIIFDNVNEEDEFINITHNHWTPKENDKNFTEKQSTTRKNKAINLKMYNLKSTIGKIRFRIN